MSDHQAYYDRIRRIKKNAPASTYRPRNIPNSVDLRVMLFSVREDAKYQYGTKMKASVRLLNVSEVAQAWQQMPPESQKALGYVAVDSHTIRFARSAPAKNPDAPEGAKIHVDLDETDSRFYLRDGLDLSVTFFSKEPEMHAAMPPYTIATMHRYHVNTYYADKYGEWNYGDQCDGLTLTADSLNRRAPIDRVRGLIDLQTQHYYDPMDHPSPVQWRSQFFTLPLGGWPEEVLFGEPRDVVGQSAMMFDEQQFIAFIENNAINGPSEKAFHYVKKDDVNGQKRPAMRQEVTPRFLPDVTRDESESIVLPRIYLYDRTCLSAGISQCDMWIGHQMVAPMPLYVTFDVFVGKNQKTKDPQTSLFPVAVAWDHAGHCRRHGVRVGPAWVTEYLKEAAPVANEENALNADKHTTTLNVGELTEEKRAKLLANAAAWEFYVLAWYRVYDDVTDTKVYKAYKEELAGQPDTIITDPAVLAYKPGKVEGAVPRYTLFAVKADDVDKADDAGSHAGPLQISSAHVPYELAEVAAGNIKSDAAVADIKPDAGDADLMDVETDATTITTTPAAENQKRERAPEDAEPQGQPGKKRSKKTSKKKQK